jgi:hypothetical protein
MTTIITALILFGIIVLAHELGHFLVAGWVGIPAEEFSIGMGPKITQLKGKKIKIIPRAALRILFINTSSFPPFLSHLHTGVDGFENHRSHSDSD